MKANRLSLFTLLLSISVSPILTHADDAAGKPGRIEAEVTQLSATVTAIDKENRTVTLEGSEGKTVTIDVDEEVRNFDQVELGDNLNVEYFESLAIVVTPAGEAANMKSRSDVELAPAGGKPGITQVDTVELTAIVEAIDMDNRLVTLKGPDGETAIHKVQDPTVNLEQVEVGDQVVAQITQAIAISVKQP